MTEPTDAELKAMWQLHAADIGGIFYYARAVLAKWGTPQPAPATQQPEGDVVAYLDVGASGYLDLGAALSEDALQQLPKGRHALVIAGTYGIDGYVAAPQPSPKAQAADSVPAVEREQERTAFKDAHQHLELYEVPDAWGRPMFKHSHVEASWLGWIARASHGQAPAPTHEQIAAYLESTGAYVTNDATREAAIAEAIDTDRVKRGQAPDLHPKTSDLVQRFAAALAEKLSAAEKKYGYSDGWASPNWMDECRQHLSAHIAKGDPRDVAAYCAFLWHHGATTASPQAADTGTAPGAGIAAGVVGVPRDELPECVIQLQEMWDTLEKKGKATSADLIRWSNALYSVERALAPPAASHGQAPAETGNSVSAQADSVPAIQGETNVQLDTDPNPTAPGQQRDMACSLALGQPVGNGSDQVAGHPSAQGDKLLTVAERNIRSFLRRATFKSESDREAALNCVDVLWEAARASEDSVQEDAARYQWIRGPVEESTRYSRWRIEYWDGPNGWQPMQRERMDSAIDAARKQGGAT